MELKEREFAVQCAKGNKATAACTKADCKSPSLMCGDPKCSCLESHSDCKGQITLNKLMAKFQSKHANIKSLFALVYDWYQSQIKLLTIQMEHFMREIENMEWKLEGHQDKLYTYLIEGKSNLVVPSLVAAVERTLFENIRSFIQKEKEVKKLLEREGKKVDKILQNVKQRTKSKIIEKDSQEIMKNFKFHLQLHHPNLTIVDNQTIKVKNGLNFGAALIQPSLLASNKTSCEVRLKIKRTIDSGFLFGVYQLTPNFRITDSYICNLIQHGSFTWSGQDQIKLGKSEGHRKESSNMTKYQTNDQIEIEYWRETERVEVRNSTKGTKSVSFIKSDKNLPLHFAVLLFDKDDQAKIINNQCFI